MALLCAADFPQAYPKNNISFQAGGIMTRSMRMLIDLDSGDAWIAEAPAHARTGRLPEAEMVALSPDQLRKLRLLASEVAVVGMKTPECIATDERQRLRYARYHQSPLPVLPPMDAMVSFSVSVDGKFASRPIEEGCETKASQDLYTLMYDSLHPTDNAKQGSEATP